jgi:HrpA-like RNA helicase
MHFFDTASLVRVQGRTYPTQIFNILEPVENYLDTTFNTILQIHYKEAPGDILAFLTGEDEIVYLNKKLNKTVEEYKLNNLEVLMLYSALPHEYQHRIFSPPSDAKRRIILATNIAETSLTINGLRYVVDPGFMKIRVFDSLNNVDMLSVVPISRANALQRAGRAGREAEGKCYRLYTQYDHDQLQEQTAPEVLRSELTGPLLQLKAIGVARVKELKFMDQPSAQTIDHSLLLLRNLRCIN